MRAAIAALYLLAVTASFPDVNPVNNLPMPSEKSSVLLLGHFRCKFSGL